jgi:hypothetical protein
MAFSDYQKDITAYACGKKWYWYLPLWCVGGYVFIGLLDFDPNKQLPFLISIAQSFDFMLHEMAHIVTAFLPALLTAAAGSISELLLGATLVIMAWRQRSYFTVLITSLWCMLACQSVGTYMADARQERLQLVSLGGALSGSDKTIHDWNFIFGRLHMLAFDRFIGGCVRAVGVVIGLGGLIFSAWLIYRMAATPQPISNQMK